MSERGFFANWFPQVKSHEKIMQTAPCEALPANTILIKPPLKNGATQTARYFE
jgi:hypothetical protein